MKFLLLFLTAVNGLSAWHCETDLSDRRSAQVERRMRNTYLPYERHLPDMSQCPHLSNKHHCLCSDWAQYQGLVSVIPQIFSRESALTHLPKAFLSAFWPIDWSSGYHCFCFPLCALAWSHHPIFCQRMSPPHHSTFEPTDHWAAYACRESLGTPPQWTKVLAGQQPQGILEQPQSLASGVSSIGRAPCMTGSAGGSATIRDLLINQSCREAASGELTPKLSGMRNSKIQLQFTGYYKYQVK